MSWWDDLKWKPVERTESVTDTARKVWTWGMVTCDCCGQGFKPKRRHYGTKYCSSKCRQKAYRQNKKQD